MIPDLAWWGWLAAFLLAQTALMVGAATLVNYKIRAPQGRRAVWQAALLAMACVWLGETAGLGEKARSLWPRKGTRTALATGQFTMTTTQASVANLPVEPAVRVPRAEPAAPVTWPGNVWLLGTLLLLLRAGAHRSWLAWQRRRMAAADVEIQETVARLRAALKLSGVEVRMWTRLRGPVAFGWWRPTVALPHGFSRRFTGAQREAMLAHELAHLAARDPVWLALADTVCALAWWNPLVWWSATQLRAASEAAADEASALVPAGPSALAESLIRFGRELAESGPARGLGVAGSGFRSGLGRRVEVLLTSPVKWRELPAIWRWSPRVLAAIFVAVLTSWPVISGPSGSVAGLLVSSARAEWISQIENRRPAAPAGETAGQPVPVTSTRVIHKILFQHLGPQTVSDSVIRARLGSKEGERRSRAQVSKDMEDLYATGLFRSLHLAETNTPDGVDLIFVVREQPVITDIKIVGNKKMSLEVLQKALTCKAGEPLDEFKLFHNAMDMQELYQKAGYRNATVRYLRPAIDEKAGRASVTIEIRETPTATPGTAHAMDGGGTAPDVVEPIDSVAAPKTVVLEVKMSDALEGSAVQIFMDKLFRQMPPDESAGPEALAQFLREAKILHPENIRADYVRTKNEAVILTSGQWQAAMDSLLQAGCNILALPKTTSASGSRTELAVANIMDVVTGVTRTPTPHGATNSYFTEPLATGRTAQLHSIWSADGWNLSASSRTTDFLGYDKPEKPEKDYTIPLPRLRIVEVEGQGMVRTDETLALRGPAFTETNRVKTTVLGIFHRTQTETVRKRIYVFVTAVSETN